MLHKHFENKDYVMFDVDEIEKRGFFVEIWNLYNLKFHFAVDKPLRAYEGNELKTIDSKDELLKLIDSVNMRRTFFILYPGEAYDESSNFLREIIVKNKGRYANYHYPLLLSEMEGVDCNKRTLKQIFCYYKKRWTDNPNYLYEDITMLKNTWLYPSTFELLQGEAGYSRVYNQFMRNSKKCILLHSIDFDSYIRSRDNAGMDEEFSKNYAVFIDAYMEGHSDFQKEGMRKPLESPDRYYNELNYFFEQIEKKYGCEVVIALHPKAEYKNNPYNGRKLYLNKTHKLIKNAKICILHDSTCFPFILYFQKPYFQILTTDLKCHRYLNDSIMANEKHGYSKVMDVSKVNQQNIENYLNIYNPNIHKKYLELYMSPGANPNKLNMVRICELISKLGD